MKPRITEEEFLDFSKQDMDAFEEPSVIETTGEYSITPSVLDYGDALARGITKGIVESPPYLLSGLAGLNTGMVLAPGAGPFAPIMPLAGLGFGLVGGSFLEEDYKDYFESIAPDFLKEYIEPPLDYELSSTFAGGETFGSGALFIPGSAFTLPRTLTKKPDFMTKVFMDYGKQARENKLGFGLSEGIALTGAGAGGGAAVEYFPDSPVARFFGELGGGISTNIVRGLVRTIPMAGGGFRAMKNKVSEITASQDKKARNNAIQQLNTLFKDPDVQEAMESSGETLETIIKRLREPVEGTEELTTSSLKSGSQVLTQLEKTLMDSDDTFSIAMKNRYEKLNSKYQQAINLLVETGNPELIQLAARTQDNVHLNLINTLMENTEKKILDIRKKSFLQDTPEARKEIGSVIERELRNSIKNMRDTENELFDLARKATFTKVKSTAKDDLKQIVTPTSSDKSLTGGTKNKKVVVTGTKVKPRVTQPNRTVYTVLDMIGNNRLDLNKLDPKDVALIKKIMGGNKNFRFNKKVFEKGMNTAEYRGIDLPEGVERGLPEGMVSQLVVSKKISLEDLANLRSSLLSTIRSKKAGVDPDFKLAGAVQEIQDAVLNDIKDLNIPEYNQAISMSKMIATYFRTKFPQEITKVDSRGATKLPAEILVQNSMNTLSAMNDKTTLKMLEVMDAVQLDSWQKSLAPLGESAQAAQIRDTFEKVYRDNSIQKVGNLSREDYLKKYQPIAKSVYEQGPVVSVNSALKQLLVRDADSFFGVDQKTGKTVLDMNKLAQWRVNNREIINKLDEITPGLNKDLDDAETAATYFADILNNKKTQEVLLKQELFSDLVGDQSPSILFTKIYNDKSGKSFKDLIRSLKMNTTEELAKTTGRSKEDVEKILRNELKETQTDVFDGLKSAYFNHAIINSVNKDGVIDVGKFTQYFFNRKRDANTDSIADMFLKEGVFSQNEYTSFKKLLTQMGDLIQRARVGGDGLGAIIQGQNALEDIMTRFMGAQVAGLANPGGPGSLSFASSMIKQTKNIFEKMPMFKARLVLQEAIKDPALMADLLESSYQPTKNNLNVIQRLFRTLLGSNILPATVATMGVLKDDVDLEFTEGVLEQFEEVPEIEPSSRLQYGPTNLPTTSGVVNPGPPTRGLNTGINSPLTSSGGSPSQSNNSRQMLQALFPLDPVLGAGRPPSA